LGQRERIPNKKLGSVRPLKNRVTCGYRALTGGPVTQKGCKSGGRGKQPERHSHGKKLGNWRQDLKKMNYKDAMHRVAH